MNEKNQALAEAIVSIKKQYGKEAIQRYGEASHEPIAVISSGSLAVDIALGVGGYPRGRIIEAYGQEASGKTTLALHAIAEVQRAGGTAAFIDAEHALDPVYAKAVGVDIDRLLISQPDDGEQALEIAETLTKSGAVDIIVIDSVAALVPRNELLGNIGDPQMGLQARMMSQALRKLTAVTSKSKTCLFFINQLRDKIGIVFGAPSVTTGGKALKFYASQRIEVTRTGTNKTDDIKTSNSTRVKIAKNKVAAPYKEAEIEIVFGEGISKESELIAFGVANNLIEKSGAYLSYNGQKLGQGKEAARTYLKNNPDISNELESRLREIYFPTSAK